jgi:hypothetical protein
MPVPLCQARMEWPPNAGSAACRPPADTVDLRMCPSRKRAWGGATFRLKVVNRAVQGVVRTENQLPGRKSSNCSVFSQVTKA